MGVKRIIVNAAIAAAFVLAFASVASAQATRTWVSGVGDDANPCSRTAPCKTFPGAISKTAAGGEINCLDPGGFGAVTITKSMTINCDATLGGALVSGTNGIIVSAGATDIVTLIGLDLEGLGTGLSGVLFNTGAALHVQKSHIRDFRGGGSGITFQPSGASSLFVDDCDIADNGNSATTGGILIRPTGTGGASVSINRTHIENNTAGIRADSSATSGFIRGGVHDTTVAGNANNGITAVSGGAIAGLIIDHCNVLGNNYGLVVNGGSASLIVNNTVVTTNNTGLFVNGSGSLYSYRNNAVNGNNGVDGSFTSFLIPE